MQHARHTLLRSSLKVAGKGGVFIKNKLYYLSVTLRNFEISEFGKYLIYEL